MLDYIYHMTLQLFCHLIFGVKLSIFCLFCATLQ